MAAMDEAEENGANFEETEQEILTDEVEAEVEAETEAEVEAEAEAEAEAEVEAEAGSEAEAEAEDKPDTRSIKAPVGWAPKEREDWSKIPPHLQRKIMERENQVDRMLNDTAPARKTYEQLTQLANSYAPVLNGAVAGSNPLEQIESLFSTVGSLRMGTPVQKAQTIADLIDSFGVDVAALDSLLVGSVPETSTESQVEQLVAQRLAPIEQQYQQEQQLRYQQSVKAANQTAADFLSKAEFGMDVRDDMADFIELAAKQGREMSMQEAYERACAVNPQIQEVIQERKQREQLMNSSNNIKQKRAAASSLSGKQGGNSVANGGGSIRDSILDAIDSM